VETLVLGKVCTLDAELMTLLIGLGLMAWVDAAPILNTVPKFLSIAYLVWLAATIATSARFEQRTAAP
jgi:threonine/homoserine/homoserine lactone efflux protein